ncbi:hypothetical protein GPJ56_003218 [Histomonas meleagridis]|uniref:uncharacterized protein n=1 Tax=Histomonas meleagridis TaxID=135588 RepID=UPI00355981E4|nr:hypothetical protein GPJ56_003218 [Histomonas meleagridis]KAH0803149.1 hypothetical protein GO595_004062 [Histomonas meleagridis]
MSRSKATHKQIEVNTPEDAERLMMAAMNMAEMPVDVDEDDIDDVDLSVEEMRELGFSEDDIKEALAEQNKKKQPAAKSSSKQPATKSSPKAAPAQTKPKSMPKHQQIEVNTPEDAERLMMAAMNMAEMPDDVDDGDLDDVDLSVEEMRELGFSEDDIKEALEEQKKKKQAAKKEKAPPPKPQAQDAAPSKQASKSKSSTKSTSKKPTTDKKPPVEKGAPKKHVKKEEPHEIDPNFPYKYSDSEEYENVFENFTQCFYNLLLNTDNPEICSDFSEKLEELLPIICDGPEEEIPDVNLYSFPKSPVLPFAKWRNVKQKAITPRSAFQTTQDVDKVLKAQQDKLETLKQKFVQEKNNVSAKKVDEAIDKTKKSKLKLPSPPFLVPNYLELVVTNVNLSVSEKEIQVGFLSASGYKGKGPYQICVRLPSISSQFVIKVEGSDVKINKSLTSSSFDPKVALKEVQRTRAKIFLQGKQAEGAEFSCAQLLKQNSFKTKVTFSGITVELMVSIRAPIEEGVKTVRTLEQYFVSPLVLQYKSAAQQQEVINLNMANAPAPAPAQAKKPAQASTKAPPQKPAATTKPPAQAPAKPAAPAPAAPPPQEEKKYFIFPQKEIEQFWPITILEIYKEVLENNVKMFQGGEVPLPLKKQFLYVNKKIEDLVGKIQSEEISQEQYIKLLKASIAREVKLSKTITDQNEKENILGKVYKMMEELKGFEEQ